MIDTSNWKEFRVGDLFPILTKGKCGDASNLVDGDEVNYIGAKWSDNGVMKSCAKNENSDFLSPGNCIAMIGQGEGSSGYAIYLDRDFIGATSLNLGYADWINPYTGLFVATILCQEYDKYSFGRSWTGNRLKNTIISLPATPSGEPDWKYMEDFMGGLHSEPLKTSVKSSHIPLETEKWGEFRVGDIFNCFNGKGLTNEEILEFEGDIPCIQGGAANNGSIGLINRAYCEKQSYLIIDEPCLTVARVGTAGYVNFWNTSCAIGDKCKGLIFKEHHSIECYLFCQEVLNCLSYKYSYGRGLNTAVYLSDIIRLPQTPDGEPDWKWMDNYMRSLPYSDLIAA